MDKLTIINSPLQDPSDSGDEKRIKFRQDYVLGKPIVQLAVVEAIVRLAEPDPDDNYARLSMDEIYRRLNKGDWGVDNNIWQRILLNGDRVITGNQARKFAARFLSYYFGGKLDEVETNQLSEQYSGLFDESGKSLPKSIIQN